VQGLFKVEYEMDGRVGHSVMYVDAGRMIGGNTAFALIGRCQHIDREMVVEIETQRHHPSRTYPHLLEAGERSIRMRGGLQGQAYGFTGEVIQEPGKEFRALMTPFNDDHILPPGRVGESGIVNGLYALEMRMPEGKARVDTGVMLLYDGRILGSDAFFYYVGVYSSANGRWKGEFINQEHTSARLARPMFSGREVGLGFSGPCDATSASADASAFAGKFSIRFAAKLKLIEPCRVGDEAIQRANPE
jgi:hypothetical protein